MRTFFSGHSSIGQGPILAWGTEDQKRRFLTPSARGEFVCAFGLTEPEAGSNPREMTMTYRRRGDEFVLNGEKYLISNGGIAGVIVTFAYPEGRSGRISAFLVETHRPGFTSESLEPKVGNVTADTVRFVLRDYAIPAANLLGAEGEGFAIAMSALVGGRLSVAAGCLGVIEDCLSEVVSYSKARRQHGKPIARHQLVQEHITAIEMDRLTTEALVLLAAEAKEASSADPPTRPCAPGRPARRPGQAPRLARRLRRRRPCRAGLRRPGLPRGVPPRPPLSGHPRRPPLRGDRRDPHAQDRRGGAGQGIRGIPMSRTWRCRGLVPALLTLGIIAGGSARGEAEREGVIATEFVFEQAPVPSCHASTIAETPAGLVAAWFGGTREGDNDVGIWLARRVDDRWTPPVEVANGRQNDGTRYPCWNPVLFQAKGGPLLLFYKVGPKPNAWWGMLITSTDEGRTWSPPARLPEGILGPIKNKPVVLADGRILCPSSTEDQGWRVHLERTADLGRTWTTDRPAQRRQGRSPPSSPRSCSTRARRLQIVCRSRQGKIVEAWSADGGATWGPLQPTALPNPNSGIDAVTLADGRADPHLQPHPEGPLAAERRHLRRRQDLEGRTRARERTGRILVSRRDPDRRWPDSCHLHVEAAEDQTRRARPGEAGRARLALRTGSDPRKSFPIRVPSRSLIGLGIARIVSHPRPIPKTFGGKVAESSTPGLNAENPVHRRLEADRRDLLDLSLAIRS